MRNHRRLPSPLKNAEDRFWCPYPGCKRSFAELWRLKVHYRAGEQCGATLGRVVPPRFSGRNEATPLADPDVRGSGKERGHGEDLPFCPKCRDSLEANKHHMRCTETPALHALQQQLALQQAQQANKQQDAAEAGAAKAAATKEEEEAKAELMMALLAEAAAQEALAVSPHRPPRPAVPPPRRSTLTLGLQ